MPLSTQKHRLQTLAVLAILMGGVLGHIPRTFASSWSPTLIVNTEAFQVIDDTDSSADLYLQFGGSLNKRLTYDRTLGSFKFDDDLEVIGSISGATLFAQDSISTSGSLVITSESVAGSSGNEGANAPSTVVSDSTIGAGATPSWTNPSNATASDDVYAQTADDYGWNEHSIKLYVGGSYVGDDKSTNDALPYSETTYTYGGSSDTWGLTLTPSDINSSSFGFGASYEGGVRISEYLRATNFGFSIPSDATIVGIVAEVDVYSHVAYSYAKVDQMRLTVYYNDPSTPNSIIKAEAGKLGIGTSSATEELEVVGTVSGSTVHAQDNLSTSGSLAVESSFYGAGLTNCSTASTSKLLWNSSTGQFSCGTDTDTDTDTDTHFSGTGSLQNFFDNRYVNTSGDTMTGALTIDNQGSEPSLNVRGTASGQIIHAQDLLTSSGNILSWGNLTINSDNSAADAVLTFGNDAAAETLRFSDTTNGFIFSNDVEVQGTASGASIHAQDNLSSSGSLAVESGFYGAGLSNCNTGSTDKLLWDSSTGQFSCGTDQTGGSSSGFSGTGSLQDFFDNRYVQTAGDTMTGALTLNVTDDTVTTQVDVYGSGTTALRLARTGTTTGATLARTNANVFTLTNMVTKPSPGGNTYSVSLDGIDDYVTAAGYDNWTEQTISVWFKTSGNSEAYPRVIEKGLNSEWTMTFNSSIGAGHKLVVQIANGVQLLTSSADLDDGQWHNAVLTISSTYYANLYIDGSFNSGAQGSTPSKTGDIYIGGNAGATTTEFTGNIDDVRIWDAVLSTTDISDLYNNGNGTYQSVGSNNVAWWKFDEGTGTNAVDSSSSGNNGTLTNGPTWGTGLVQNASTIETATIISSTDGSATSEKGIVKFGDTGGSTWLQGRDVQFNVGGTEKARFSSGGLLGIGTTTPTEAVEVVGTVSGTTLHAEDVLTSSGNILSWGNLTINSDNSAADAVLTFGNDAAAETLRFSDTTNGFIFSNDVEVQGTASGSQVHGQDSLTSSGALVFEGAASGSSLYLGDSLTGAGLSDCSTGSTDKLLWDSATGRFSCGTDQTGGSSSGFSGTGSLQDFFDNRYVQTAGDTMTGALTIKNSAPELNLYLAGTSTGTTLVRSGSTLLLKNDIYVTGDIPANSNSATFDGTGDKVEATITSTDPTDFTMAAWVKPAALSGYQTIMEAGTYSITMLTSDTKLTYMCNGVGYTSLSNTALSTGTWQHVAVTRSGNDITFYINGSADANTYTNTQNTNAFTAIRAGDRGDQPQAWNGKIDDSRFYSTALSASEIAQLYNSGNGTFNGPASNMIVWWKYDEASGTVTDYSGNGYDGTLQGNAVRSSDTPIVSTGGADAYEKLTLIQSTNSSTKDERGILTLGASSGSTILQGRTLQFKNFGNESARITSGGLLGIGTTTPTETVEVVGTVSGTTLHAEDVLTSSGNILSWGNLTINSDNSAADAVLTFGNDAAAETLRFSDTTNGFIFSNDVEVQGTASGSQIHGTDSVTSSGTLVFEGAASGSSLYLGDSLTGAGLSDCSTGSTDKLLWDSATGRFSCGTDQTGGGGSSFSGTGSLQDFFDNRFVNTSGDTMTGALLISTGSTALTLSGASIEQRFTDGEYSRIVRTASTNTLSLKNRVFQKGIDGDTGNAIDFDGTDDVAFVFNSETLPTAFQNMSDNITVSLWFKADAVTGSWAITEWTLGQTIVGLRTEGGTYKVPFNFGLEDSTIALGVSANNDTSDEIINGGTTLNAGQWYHAAFTINGDDVILYLDGSEDASTTLTTASADRSIGTSTSNLTIGARSTNDGGTSTRYAGLVDDLRIYDRTLSAAEISAIYNNGNGTTGGTTDSLQAEYLFDESSGTVASDETANSYDADVQNGATFVSGKIPTIGNGSMQETDLVISQNSDDSDEAGVVQFGDPDGKTELRGQTLTFMSDTTATEIMRITSGGLIGINTTTPTEALEIVGTASGSQIHGTDSVTSSGTLVFEGAASGSSLYLGDSLTGAGLSDCSTGSTDKLLWDSATGRFSCGTDQTGGSSGGFSGTGSLQNFFDNRYVEVGGDTMTGALKVDSDIRSSGSLIVEGTAVFKGDVLTKGIVWDAQSASSPSYWRDVVYGNGMYVAIASTGTYRIMTSPDGVNWTSHYAPENNSWNDIAYGNGMFVAVAENGTHRVMTSPDGINWTVRDASEVSAWYGVAYGNGKFVAVAYSGTNRVMTSPDGITWTSVDSGISSAWDSITYGDGLFVVGAISGTTYIMTSPDGETWTSRSTTGYTWRDVTYGNGMFVAVSQYGTVLTSPDGETWTSRSPPESNYWNGVTYGDGVFVAVSLDGTNRAMTSTGGITWTPRSVPASGWAGVTYGNGQFVAVAYNGTNQVMTSGSPEFNDVPHDNTYQGGLTLHGNLTTTASSKEGSGALTVTPVEFQSGAYLSASGASVLALDNYSGTSGSGSNAHIAFGYKNVFDTFLYRHGDSGSGGLVVKTQQTSSALNAFRVVTQNGSENNTVFKVRADGTVTADGSISGGGADLAEWFPTADPGMTPGDIACLDPERPHHVKRCNGSVLTVAGIVSTKPGFIGNPRGNIEGDAVQIGLIGQVPVKVTGTVSIGDSITLSSADGVGRKANSGETNICSAMEPHTGSDVGTIVCLLNRNAVGEQLGFGQKLMSKLDDFAEQLAALKEEVLGIKEKLPETETNGTVLTLDESTVEVTGTLHKIAAEDGEGVLARLEGGKLNQTLVLQAAEGSDITVRKTKKILLTQGDCELQNEDDVLVLMKIDDDMWVEISRNGSSVDSLSKALGKYKQVFTLEE